MVFPSPLPRVSISPPAALLPKTPTARAVLQRPVEATDREIYWLVYDLYDLTGDEIKIVEEAT